MSSFGHNQARQPMLIGCTHARVELRLLALHVCECDHLIWCYKHKREEPPR